MRSTAVRDQDAAAAGAVAPRPGRRALFEQLRADGVRFMFGNPGTVEQGFLDEVRDFPDVQYILTLQETIAVGVALAIGWAYSCPPLRFFTTDSARRTNPSASK